MSLSDRKTLKHRDYEDALRKIRSDQDTLPLVKQVIKWNVNSQPSSIDDREAILVSYILLEQSLKMLLLGKLELFGIEKANKIFDFDGGKPVIFGTVYNRAIFAVTTDLITERCFKDVQDISTLRNTFAHSASNLRCDNEAVEALTRLRCLTGVTGQFRLFADGEIFLNFFTARARFTAFIILFWMFCATDSPAGYRPFSKLFQPFGPFPRKLSTQDFPVVGVDGRVM